MLGIRKIVRKDNVQDALVGTPPTLVGAVYIYGRVGCLSKNTKILILENNKVKEKSLSKLNDTFKVVSYNLQTLQHEYSDAMKIDSGQKELYEIEFNNGAKVLASKDHIFFDKNLHEIKTQDLIDGQLLFYSPCPVKNRNCWSKKEIAIKGNKNVFTRKDVFKN